MNTELSVESNVPVSVLTPVHNGADHLSATIRSVLAQTYRNFEYIIVDNASTDSTGEIAARFAAEDRRIRVVRRAELLPIMDNWNAALADISPEAQFVKIIHADDLLYPRCLEMMVRAASDDEKIGIVSAYRAEGDNVTNHGLDAEDGIADGSLTTRVSGRSIAAKVLQREAVLFGSPSTLLLRADLVRCQGDFYDASLLHADTDACLKTLMDNDFAFVHEVLTYTRRHEGSMTSTVARLASQRTERLVMMRRYGLQCMTEADFRRLWDREVEQQYRLLLLGILEGRGRVFRAYQAAALGRLGLMPSRLTLLARMISLLKNPSRVLGHLRKRALWRDKPEPEDVSDFLKWTRNASEFEA